MIKFREILRLSSMGLSQRSIASSCQCSRNTVSEVVSRANERRLESPLPDDVTDSDLQYLLFPEKAQSSSRSIPDCEWIHRELAKSGVTLSLLWHEYCEQCRTRKEIPLQYTQFCNHYRKFAAVTKATMHIQHKPGEKMEVDWAGQTASLVDRDTGELIPVYIFVAALSCSLYAYVEGFLDQKQESWITAHTNAFAHGIPPSSTKRIMKWLNIMAQRLSLHVSESRRTSQARRLDNAYFMGLRRCDGYVIPMNSTIYYNCSKD